MTQMYETISNMYINGITLSTGTKLTAEEVTEIRNDFRLLIGISAYEYVYEDVDDDVEMEAPETLDMEVFEKIEEYLCDEITGEDEIYAVNKAIGRE